MKDLQQPYENIDTTGATSSIGNYIYWTMVHAHCSFDCYAEYNIFQNI